MSSWVSTDAQPGFSLQNLPYGVFSTSDDSRHRIGVAIGSNVLDLRILAQKQVFKPLDFDLSSLEQATLNCYAGLGHEVHNKVRRFLQEILSSDTLSADILRDNAELRNAALIPMEEAQMHLPMAIGDYTDFFTSPYHARNCTEIVRPGTHLPHNFWRMPLGYHGRVSSIVVSGTPIQRPKGQFLSNDSPTFGPSQKLDFEVEFAAFIGGGNEIGTPISVDEAESHIFGFVLLNDWSARDIQRAETGLMGPLNGKNFATSISPWIIPLEALEPFRTAPLLEVSLSRVIIVSMEFFA
ncbi:fumarylacetoacetase [Cladophialophora immunda]|uniref:Fumarylacetoacetase n=1 Tax=Cladophialophora immunda TaxID=569365 RepID=A0A0D1ZTQ5_9EURO|nr:fumarylacetoacetase [Cladophialophora immunda]KIW31456.1 fumarylacetoacetase [Cladophialophora immunda]OQV08100.1 hypothetical protein CLAIMM_12419 [Cladophialophora immunda]